MVGSGGKMLFHRLLSGKWPRLEIPPTSASARMPAGIDSPSRLSLKRHQYSDAASQPPDVKTREEDRRGRQAKGKK